MRHTFVSYINRLTYSFSFFFPQLILHQLRSVFASACSLPFSILTLSLGSLSGTLISNMVDSLSTEALYQVMSPEL
jgi:hypothetical protein